MSDKPQEPVNERTLRTPSNQYNAVTDQTMGYQDIRNTAENWAIIMRLFKEGRAKGLEEEPKKLLEPCIVLGSGASLDDKIEKLKAWKGGIVSHFSQASTLIYYGIVPDYIICLDAICNWEAISSIDWKQYKTKLVSHPGMWPSLFANWPNEILFYRQNLNKPDGFTMDEQKKMFTERQGTLDDALASKIAYKILMRTEITSFACTPPTQVFVAKFLQYGNIFLCGLDFAYINDLERFTDYQNIYGKWIKNEHKLDLQRTHPYVLTTNGLKTDPLHLYYKKNFLSACRMSEGLIYTTDKGAITEMPYIDIDLVIKHQGRKVTPINMGVRNKNYERYLATQNCFCIEFESGMAFVEVQDPLKDIKGYCMESNKRHVCTACNASLVKNDYEDGTGEECPQCRKKALRRANPVDMVSTMKKITALIEYVKETA